MASAAAGSSRASISRPSPTEATVPASVTFGVFETSLQFTVTGQDDTLLDGTITVSDLDVKVNAAGIGQLGLIGVLPGADLLKLSLSLPQL